MLIESLTKQVMYKLQVTTYNPQSPQTQVTSYMSQVTTTPPAFSGTVNDGVRVPDSLAA